MTAPGADRLIERVVAGHGAEEFPIALPEARHGIIVEAEFGNHGQHQALDGLRAALGQRIEDADTVDLVAEQIDAQRRRRPRREDIHEAAARRVIAGLGDRAGAQVAVALEKFHQIVERHAAARDQLKPGVGQGVP